MNTIVVSKLKKYLKQHIQSEQSCLDIESLWSEYLSVTNNTEREFDLDTYVDWLVDSIIESSDKLHLDTSRSTAHSDYDTMLYHITDTIDNKSVEYEFDQFNWLGSKEELYYIVLPVLEKLKFI